MESESRQFGIDVSHYQGTIDWRQARQLDITFAFIKATEGVTGVDPNFKVYWTDSRAMGVLCGAYHFYQPGDDPEKQAHHFLETAAPGPGDLRPVLDVEVSNEIEPAQIVDGIQTWLETVQQAIAVEPIIYTSPEFWNGLRTDQFGDYPLWVANYGVKTPELPAGWSAWTFWQYSQSKRIRGVQGIVDLDVFNGTIEQLELLRLPRS